MSDWTGITSPEHLITKASENTDGLFGIGIWGVTYLVLFITFTIAATRMGSNEPAKEGFLVSSLLMAPLSYYMGVLEWVTLWFTAVPTVLAVIGIIVITVKD